MNSKLNNPLDELSHFLNAIFATLVNIVSIIFSVIKNNKTTDSKSSE